MPKSVDKEKLKKSKEIKEKKIQENEKVEK